MKSCHCMKVKNVSHNFHILSSKWPQGGGGVTAIGAVPLPDARESTSEKHPKRGFNGTVYQKTPCKQVTGPIPTS